MITSSLAVLEELLPCDGIELISLGGVVRRNYRSLVGVLAEDTLRQLTADISFLGASGIRRRPVRHGHDDGRGADQARDDRGRRARGAARRRGEVRHGRHRARLRRRGARRAVVTDAAADAASPRRQLARAGVEVVHA